MPLGLGICSRMISIMFCNLINYDFMYFNKSTETK